MIDVRKIQIVNLGVSLIFAYSFFSWNLLSLALGAYLGFLGLGVNVGLHRGFSHANLSPDSIFGRFCLFFGVLACLGRPSDWILVHRLHHMYTDRLLDPHSPLRLGRWKVFANQWSLSQEIPMRTLLSIKRQVLKSPSLRFFDKHYLAIIFGYLLFLFVLGGSGAIVYGWSIPATASLLATSLVNAFCHDRQGNILNVKWISLLTLGEGFHGYHHAHPQRRRAPVYGAFDVSGWVLEKAVGRAQ